MRPFLLAAISVVSMVSESWAQRTINPEDVPIDTRNYWCLSQQTQCPLICTQETPDQNSGYELNDCDPETLVYACVCANGVEPNATEYSQTIPYFICTQAGNQCVDNCAGDNICQSACREDYPCGAQDPRRINATTATTSTTASSTGPTGASRTNSDGDVVVNRFGDSDSSTSGNGNGGSGAARMMAAGEVYGLGVVAMALFAGFTLLL